MWMTTINYSGSCRAGKKTVINTYLLESFSYLRFLFQLCLHQLFLLASQLHLILYPLLLLYLLQRVHHGHHQLGTLNTVPSLRKRNKLDTLFFTIYF